jgi:Ran GTPase-activating protein (RanGAP) involved in mRNA processing and transport
MFDQSGMSPLDLTTASILSSFYDTKPKTAAAALKPRALPEDSVLEEEEEEELSSPRTTYLEGCLNQGLKPRASLILRKNVTTEINLRHNAMGDSMAIVFAKALKDIPLINTLNLSDNALTDKGASAIIDVLVHLPNITSLDISCNKIDGDAATALADYLKSADCPLKILILGGCDIDDTECDNFITSLRCNTTIKELDMSNNKIGVSENLNVVKPDFRTGAEALATFLMKTDCPLETLKVEWNMIRLDGAVTFASSLRFNSSLTYLDVSYNSLGQQGGEMLGDALIDNKVLRTLNAGGNSFNATACFTICVGIEENYVIRNVVLDNNSIGVQGAKALLELPSTVGNRVRISAERCNINLIDSNFKFSR